MHAAKGPILLISDEDRGWGAWRAPSALAAVSAIAVLALSLAPPSYGPVALVFPPWWTNAAVAAGAARAGRLIRFGGARFVMVVQPDGRAMPGSQRGGAWLALNPRLFGACRPAGTRS